ncbi:RNA polymerase sigma factor [Planctomicrobium sp. SH668]|uniref:RNA polymerase sigma factor n=1 Tax=Planctomicrobium sp. SH668 TaxID=3448126 RepID=UPI003F5C5201
MDQTIDREFVKKLIHDHYEVVYRFAYRISGSRTDAEDLTQQTFLLVCRKLDQLRDNSRPLPWLFTIVRNCFLKSKQKVKQNDVQFDEENWHVRSENGWTEDYDEEALQAALQELPETFRTPVLLYYFDNLSYKEIADILEIPLGTVMSRLARGKENLRSRLSETDQPVTSPKSF